MKRTGAQIIAHLLTRQGVPFVSGIPGGANLPLYDALAAEGLPHVLARHEQGAGFIAQGAARATGRLGVCLATSGPGATNLVTALADAKADSVPVLAVTGQVARPLIGTDAFQEVDTFGLTLPITKHNWLVRRAADLLDVLPEAMALAVSGRPGPVLIDVPRDVQLEAAEFERWPEPAQPAPKKPCDPAGVERFAAMLAAAERPILYIGGGVVAAGASAQLTALARASSIPVVSTLMGLGAFPADDPLWLGMIGMHGTPAANRAMTEADLVVALGVRFDDRATGRLQAFCPEASVVHVDVDATEIDKLRAACLGLTADVGLVLDDLLPLVATRHRPIWRARVAELKARGSYPAPGADPARPQDLIGILGASLPEDAIVTTDVGQHQMFAAQHYPVRRPRGLLTSGGLGTMGFGLPAAIGAALACPGRQVVCVSGDGSILMNIQELATLAELDLPVTVVVLQNGGLGLVRQQQDLLFGGRYTASNFLRQPDLTAIARGFGLSAANLGASDDPLGLLAETLAGNRPALLVAPVDQAEGVYPMVLPGAANHEMIEDRNHAACH